MNQYPKIKHPQQGTVLIVVLFIVALIEIIVVSLTTQHRLAIRHTRNYLSSIEAQNIALSGEDWARTQILAAYINAKNPQPQSDRKPQKPLILNKTPIHNGYIEGIVEDMQGKLNLNNIQDKNTLHNFNHMLKSLFQSVTPTKIDQFTSTLFSEQIQKTTSNQTSNKQPSEYAFVSITELRNIPFMTQKNFESLAPYISALPDMTPLNINSATNYSLLSLGENLDLKTANAIIKVRDQLQGFSSVSNFFSIEPLQAINKETMAPLVTTTSIYYLSNIHVNYHNIDLTLYSLIKIVEKQQNFFSTEIIWRSFGTV